MTYILHFQFFLALSVYIVTFILFYGKALNYLYARLFEVFYGRYVYKVSFNDAESAKKTIKLIKECYKYNHENEFNKLINEVLNYPTEISYKEQQDLLKNK